ncbi:MAG: hypothetical protein HQ500_08490 [Flavobacteriales bacterium]|nr:hypothetical protein [Flavobacteriales bacterium]
MRSAITYLLLLLFLAACEPKPKACLDWSDTIEAGTTLDLASCSEDYDFLTWEFSDDRGYVSDVVARIFEKEENMFVKLTAYSDGAYRSDEVILPFKTSFRYVDRMEVIGESNYSALELRMAGGIFLGGDAKGIFTESAPYIVYVWPETKVVVESKRSELAVFGYKNGSEVSLGSKPYNFETYKENPMVMETTDGLLVNVYWTYRD